MTAMNLTDGEKKLIFTALNAQADRFAEMASERSGAAGEAMWRNERVMRELARKILVALGEEANAPV